MDSRNLARRDLVIAAAAVIGLARFAEGPLTWVAAALLLVALLLGTLQLLGEATPTGLTAGVPIEALLVPAVAGVACLGAVRLVPVGPGLAPALLLAAVLIDRVLRTENRLLAAPHGPTPGDRTTILIESLAVAFLGFVGTAAIVPGGLPDPGGAQGGSLSEANLVLLAAVDALIAGLLGYRLSALRVTDLRTVLWSAGTYAAAIAIAAAGLRAMDIPRLTGPAVLTLVLFLWDAFHGAPPARRRDPSWLWQTGLLAILGIAVLAWNLGLRG